MTSLEPYIIYLVPILVIAFFIYLCWYNTSKQKGKRGEKRVHDILMKLSDDYPISSDIIDLVEAMPHNECSSFIPRTNELGTKIVDWLDKMREKV